jgi:hypothetical protein
MFTDSQILEIKNYGLQVETVEKQIERFKIGFPTINITATATIGNGIIQCDEKEALKYAKLLIKKRNVKKCKICTCFGSSNTYV